MDVNDREDRIVGDTKGQSKYKKGGTAGIEGIIFQVDLLTVTLLNAYENHRGWKLSTENKRYGKFDDVVLELQDGAILLQAKHRKNRKLLFDELFSINPKSNDFSLGKYFFSYQEIKAQIQVKYVVICTNSEIIIDAGMKKFINRRKDTPDSILYHFDSSSFFTFNDSILPMLEEHVRNYYSENLIGKNVNDGVITSKNLGDFLAHLKFYSNYPSENELNSIIEQLFTRIECTNGLCDKTSSKYIQNKMLDWFRQPQGIHLEECHVKAMISEVRSSRYCQMLQKYNVFFNNAKLVFRNRKRILHVVVSKDCYLLNTLKIYRDLQNNNKILYVSPDDSTYLKYFVESFELPQYTHLIIILPKIEGQDEIRKINLKLREVLDRKSYKKVVLITEGYNRLASEISVNNDIYDTMEEHITFKDLSANTQFRLFKENNVNFQGKYVSLEELFSLEMLETCQVLDTEMTEQLIKSEKLNVGSILQSLDEHVEGFYVHRKFKRKICSVNYKEECKEEVIGEENICGLEDKLILIVDSAGAGKSTVFTHLASTIKEKLPLLWVLRINLNDYIGVLNEVQEKNGNSIDLIDFFNSVDVTKLRSQFERGIFLMERRVLLMLDGVDEVCPDYTEFVLRLILQCQKASNFYKILVTTRPQNAGGLEEKLNVKPFTLQSLTIETQIYILTNYWMHRFEAEEEKQTRCEYYAKALIHKMASWMGYNGDAENSFTVVPLQLRTLAEIFETTYRMQQPVTWNGCKEYLYADEGEPKFPKKMNIAKLYKMFIIKKRDIFKLKANPTGTTAADRALDKDLEESLKCHRSLALEAILGHFNCRYFSCYKYVDKENMETNILKIGIIQLIGNDIHFLHRTFAEYFVAEHILMELQKQQANPNRGFQKLFVDQLLIYPKYSIVRTFLDNFLRSATNPLLCNIFLNTQSFNYRINLNNTFYHQYIIHWLAREGFVEILQYLFKCIGFRTMESKKNKTINCERAKYPLIDRDLFSVESLNRLKYLTNRGGLNIQDWKDETPLHYAVQNGQLKMVNFLLKHGANVDSRDKVGNSVLWCAALSNHAEIVEVLIRKGANADTRNNANESILHYVAVRRHWSIFKLLVENGADLSRIDSRGYTVLHIVVTNSHFESIKLLIQNSADVNLKNFDGVTPLQLAVFNNQLEIVKFLIESGADVNSVDKEGCSALHLASVQGYEKIVKFLVEKCQVNVNAKDRDGYTALNWATARYSWSVKELLLKAGADEDEENNNRQEVPPHMDDIVSHLTDNYILYSVFTYIYTF